MGDLKPGDRVRIILKPLLMTPHVGRSGIVVEKKIEHYSSGAGEATYMVALEDGELREYVPEELFHSEELVLVKALVEGEPSWEI